MRMFQGLQNLAFMRQKEIQNRELLAELRTDEKLEA